MARILVAASPEPQAIIARILKGHELDFAETISQAEKCLKEKKYDEIVCTIVFDESRMFDLLRFAKSEGRNKGTPFVCARMRQHTIDSAVALEGVAIACKTLGAAAFLNVSNYSDPDREMRADFERLARKNGKIQTRSEK